MHLHNLISNQTNLKSLKIHVHDDFTCDLKSPKIYPGCFGLTKQRLIDYI